MRGHIRGANPPKPGPSVEVRRVKSTTPQKFLVLSVSVFGTWIHWYAKRSHECFAAAGKCDRCQQNWPRKWKGYFHAIELATNARTFVEITPAAFTQLANVAPSNEPLRGLIVGLAKSAGGAKGRYLVNIEGVRRDPASLPDEEDPLPVLRYLWNCKNPTGEQND